MSHVHYYSICVGIALLCSCQPDTVCRETMQVGVIGQLKETYYDTDMQSHVRTAWDSLTVQGIGSDSVLYNNSKSVSQVLLPMRSDKDTTCYAMTYCGCTDTLSIVNSHNQQFVSVECGCVYEHAIRQVVYTQHWIDTIVIASTEVKRGGGVNIYFIREAQTK